MISTSKKFVFIHVPKTAGNAVQNILRHYSDDDLCVGASPRTDEGIIDYLEVGNPLIPKLTKHSGVGTLYSNWNTRRLGDIEDYFKFATVRNPWDRAISFYFWRRFKTFTKNTFLEEVVARVPPMHHYLTYKEQGVKKIDYILRYENLTEDFARLCNTINIKHEPLPVANKSHDKTKHYTEYYDDETREAVAKKYAKDIEAFGYEFEG
jgi:hypothetical protein